MAAEDTVSLTRELETVRHAVLAARLLCQCGREDLFEGSADGSKWPSGATAVLRLVEARLRLLHRAITRPELVEVLQEPFNAAEETPAEWEDRDVRLRVDEGP